MVLLFQYILDNCKRLILIYFISLLYSIIICDVLFIRVLLLNEMSQKTCVKGHVNSSYNLVECRLPCQAKFNVNVVEWE